MNRYTVGLQLLSDQALFPTYITAENSDKAWDKAQEYYKDKGFNKSELTTMVLYNEKPVSPRPLKNVRQSGTKPNE